MLDLAVERAALIGLLSSGPKMEWAKYRNAISMGQYPTELGATEEHIQTGQHVIAEWHHRVGGANFYTCLDEGYPAQLRDVWDFPPFVFIRGDETPLRRLQGDVGVCVVGSRKPTQQGHAAADFISRQLAQLGITIISGLAEGVDRAAHQAALETGARTVGVIGTGIDRYYPTTSRPYQEAMENGHGMVLSQFGPGASPTRASFPMRNAVMSAYGRATIIVEASEQSGTKHQAQHAVKHGRPVILAEPVARKTTWGARLADDSSVDAHVAHTPEHAVQLARGVIDRSAPPAPTQILAF
ncbi:DNA-processing protein DprA [Nesterenkonia halobia]|uniref:Smf/DprA SLOG domain-containing protein n=1 Tax=Nesterenkonia halobia TaxID=37922 RepID=A0ABP6R9Q7_9MICC